MKDENPWTTLSTKKIYENPWIALSHREVITPGGSKGIYGKVHFKNTAIGILPIDENENTWLVGQYRYTLDAYHWEIPEGGSPHGENPLVSAQRELKEETGIVAKDWTKIAELHTSNSVTDEYGIIYLARDLKFEEACPEDTEDLKVIKVPFSEALDRVMDGRITDSVSMIGILKYAQLKKQ